MLLQIGDMFTTVRKRDISNMSNILTCVYERRAGKDMIICDKLGGDLFWTIPDLPGSPRYINRSGTPYDDCISEDRFEAWFSNNNGVWLTERNPSWEL